MNILQDMADTHAERLGFGLTFCLEHNLTWFGAAYRLQIDRMPSLRENIRVQTWPSVKKKIGAVREFLIFDEASTPIIRASSLWILIDPVRRKPLPIDKILPDYKPLEDRALETDFEKIILPPSLQSVGIEKARFDDIDLNGHVNNAVYPLWAVENTDPEFHGTHRIAQLDIAFKKECLLGERVEIKSAHDADTYFYQISAQSDSRELADIRIHWCPIEKV
jgi:acyl-ACP thioesterase